MAVFDNRSGNQTFRGTDGEYDQVDFDGNLADYTFVQNANGSVTVTHPTLGTDTLWDIDGFWFGGEQEWYSLQDALAMTASGTGFVDEYGVITGGAQDNVLTGDGTDNLFYGGMGDDIINGNGGDYNQVEADGDMREWTFTDNADGTVTMSHPTWGTDTLTDIDGFWFSREQAWYSIDDAISLTANLPDQRVDADDVLNGTAGNDVLVSTNAVNLLYGGLGNDAYIGRANNYDQVNFDGSISDYTITNIKDGIVTISHAIWGVDTLENIDGFWFAGDAQWFSINDLLNSATSISRTDVTGDVYNVARTEGGNVDTNAAHEETFTVDPAPFAVVLETAEPAPDFDINDDFGMFDTWMSDPMMEMP